MTDEERIRDLEFERDTLIRDVGALLRAAEYRHSIEATRGCLLLDTIDEITIRQELKNRIEGVTLPDVVGQQTRTDALRRLRSWAAGHRSSLHMSTPYAVAAMAAEEWT